MSTTAPWPAANDDVLASHLSQLAVDDYQRLHAQQQQHSPSFGTNAQGNAARPAPNHFPAPPYDASPYLYFNMANGGTPEYAHAPGTPGQSFAYPDLSSPMASLQSLPSLQSLSVQNLLNSSLAFEPYPVPGPGGDYDQQRRNTPARGHQAQQHHQVQMQQLGMQMQGHRAGVPFRPQAHAHHAHAHSQPLTAQSTGQGLGFVYDRQWSPASPSRGRHARLGSNSSPRRGHAHRYAEAHAHALNLQQLVYPPTPSPAQYSLAAAAAAAAGVNVGAGATFNPYAAAFPVRRYDAARSGRLDDFRRHRNSRMELADITGHICEFAGDQHGSRFIQNKLETASAEDRAMVFDEIMPNAYQLMTDVFGNYVIQKLFEHGDQAQKAALAKTMETHVLHLSMQMYGCRKALEHVLFEQRDKLVAEIAGHVIECVKSANANHVIQRLIALDPPAAIIDAFKGHVRELSCHPFGCRVLQKSFEILNPAKIRPLLNELHTCAAHLMVDQFGNYVVQSIISDAPDREADRDKVIEHIKPRIYELSRHKFASNVVEKALKYANPADRRELIAELVGENTDNPDERVASLLRDGYGNFPVQTALAEADPDQRERLLAIIVPLMPNIRHTPCGRRLEAKFSEYDTKGLMPSLSHSLSASSVNSPDLGSESDATMGTVGTGATAGAGLDAFVTTPPPKKAPGGGAGAGSGMSPSPGGTAARREDEHQVIKMLFP